MRRRVGPATTAFDGLFRADAFAGFAKLLIYRRRGASLIDRAALLRPHRRAMRAEYPVLILFAALGMGMMVSAGDLMTLYIGLELQSLAAYVLASFLRARRALGRGGAQVFRARRARQRHPALRHEPDLRLHRHDQLRRASRGAMPAARSTGALFGLVFVLAGLAFKIGAVPFHMWTPDVYEGAPTPVTAFFATRAQGRGDRAGRARRDRGVGRRRPTPGGRS